MLHGQAFVKIMENINEKCTIKIKTQSVNFVLCYSIQSPN